jgi:hypothetical protein
MLQPVVTQLCELANLESELAALRVRFLKVALMSEGRSVWGPEAEAETRRIEEILRAHFRSQEWLGRFPPVPAEPDPHAEKAMNASRETAIRSILLLHRLAMETPAVGCRDLEATEGS